LIGHDYVIAGLGNLLKLSRGFAGEVRLDCLNEVPVVAHIVGLITR